MPRDKIALCKKCGATWMTQTPSALVVCNTCGGAYKELVVTVKTQHKRYKLKGGLVVWSGKLDSGETFCLMTYPDGKLTASIKRG